MRKLPRSMAMVKSLETLDIYGCSNLEEFPKQIGNLQSLIVLNVDGITINQSLSTGGEVKAWHSFMQPQLLKLRKPPEISLAALPRSLAKLSLANCNLSDDAFPRDLSNLLSLQFLNLSDNPIQSLPDFIRALTGLQNLSIESCTRLQSLGCHEEHIFCVYLPGSKVPPWFNVTNIGSSISFAVPSLLNFRIQGFNTTKSLVWSHHPPFYGIPEADENMIWLSYWKFENQLEGGDELNVSVVGREGFQVKEVGVRIVYKEEQEEKSIQIHSTSEAAASQQIILYGKVVPGTVSARPARLNFYCLGAHFKNCRFCPLPYCGTWTLDDPKSQ
ncbi:hypothetical protein Acr_00g0018420 [Actinidia rufa]|uniref:Disease resistance protein (TIR-NBS-LRR class) family n=1 Tax=Actinidia rufa TaxID=165716 RepID=A0A7J0DCW3_9ERIC|nr:hypothetical protein Acr_00g0018420 [Actinidia rufa]